MSNQSGCTMFSACVIIALSISGLILLSKIYESPYHEVLALEDIRKNLNSKGISKIFKTNNKNCPQGSFPFLKMIVPGINTACLCKNKSNGRYSFTILYQKQCKNISKQYSCTSMKILNNQMNLYRGNNLCIKPTEFDYDAYQYVDSAKNCKSNSRVCGRDQSGFLCLGKAFPCPVNFIQIVNSNTNKVNKTIPGQKTIDLGNKVYLKYSNENVNGEIIVQTGWSFNGKCIKPYENQFEGIPGIKIFNKTGGWVGQCSKAGQLRTDPRWKELDQINLISWLGENSPIFNNLESNGYLEIGKLNTPIIIQTRGYVHFNKLCKWDKKKTISKNLKELENLKPITAADKKGMLTSIILVFSITLVCSLLLFCYSFDMENYASILKSCCVWLTIMLMLASGLLITIFVGSEVELVTDVNYFNKKCMDVITSQQMKSISENKMSEVFLIIISLALSLLGVLILSITCCCTRGYKRRNSFDFIEGISYQYSVEDTNSIFSDRNYKSMDNLNNNYSENYEPTFNYNYLGKPGHFYENQDPNYYKSDSNIPDLNEPDNKYLNQKHRRISQHNLSKANDIFDVEGYDDNEKFGEQEY